MRVAVLHRSRSVSVLSYCCDAKPGDASFDEEHTAFSLSYVRRGSFGYLVRGARHELVAGAALAGHVGDEFRCTHEHHVAGDECLSFQFSEEAARSLTARGEAFRVGALPPISNLMIAGDVACSTALGLTNLGLDEVALSFAARFVGLSSGVKATAVSVSAHDRKRAVAAAVRLDESSNQATNLDELADESGLSPFHFLRVFRKVLGVTPHQYLLRSRLRHAARLLSMELPITSVAYDAGFGDLSNFVRTFHRAAGVSPRAFRRALRGDSKIFQERLARAT